MGGLDHGAGYLNEEQVDYAERNHKRGKSNLRSVIPGLFGKATI